MITDRRLTRRTLMRGAGGAAAALTAPLFVPGRAFGANSQMTMGCIGMGGQGRGDMGGFLGFPELRVLTVCDVIKAHREAAKSMVDGKYGNKDCLAVNDYREVLRRADLDCVLIATPDHWHMIIACEAMKAGKDVYSEKPETLTIREGQILVETARRYGRVFSGGSQRVWDDYNWFHRMVRGGAIGRVTHAYVNVGGPSSPCYLPPEPVPEGVDWDLWLGPAPWVPFNRGRLNFRPWRDYSGGGMTDWGAHTFGGALFACGLHRTGPVEVIPPDGKDVKHLTYKFANGIEIHHGGGWGGILSIQGTDGEIPPRGAKQGTWGEAPNIYIPHYKGRGGIFGDFVHCMKTREETWRNPEVAHRTVSVCHLGNIAYWLNRRLRWDPEKQEMVGDVEAQRWVDRPKREPWRL
jgi:predicted dehydrogenase